MFRRWKTTIQLLDHCRLVLDRKMGFSASSTRYVARDRKTPVTNARIGYLHSVILLVSIFDRIQSIQINDNADP